MKNLLVLLALGMVAINAWSQEEKAKNIQLSVTPYSFMNKATYQTLELDEYKIHYKSTIGFNLGYEFNIGKATTLAELSYAKAKIDDVTFKPKEGKAMSRPLTGNRCSKICRRSRSCTIGAARHCPASACRFRSTWVLVERCFRVIPSITSCLTLAPSCA